MFERKKHFFLLRVVLVDYQLLHRFLAFMKEIVDGANLNFYENYDRNMLVFISEEEKTVFLIRFIIQKQGIT